MAGMGCAGSVTWVREGMVPVFRRASCTLYVARAHAGAESDLKRASGTPSQAQPPGASYHETMPAAESWLTVVPCCQRKPSHAPSSESMATAAWVRGGFGGGTDA